MVALLMEPQLTRGSIWFLAIVAVVLGAMGSSLWMGLFGALAILCTQAFRRD